MIIHYSSLVGNSTFICARTGNTGTYLHNTSGFSSLPHPSLYGGGMTPSHTLAVLHSYSLHIPNCAQHCCMRIALDQNNDVTDKPLQKRLLFCPASFYVSQHDVFKVQRTAGVSNPLFICLVKTERIFSWALKKTSLQHRPSTNDAFELLLVFVLGCLDTNQLVKSKASLVPVPLNFA